MSRDTTAVPMPSSDESRNTIAHEWQWQNFTHTEPAPGARANSETNEPRQADEVPYSAVGIYRILQSVRLDENGRVVPDQMLKEALEEGFEYLGPNASPAALSELQSSIRTGLPGQAGEQAARILEDYCRFRLAETEFNGQPLDQAPADHYEKLVQLRRDYLGAEISDKLFAVEDANGRHMFAAIAIQTNANLTDAEKEAQQGALQEKLNNSLLAQGLLEPEEVAAQKVQRLREQGASSSDIYSTRNAILGAEGAHELAAADREEARWQSHFNGFWQARQYVMRAGLDEIERERQIDQLLDQYFSADERERARVTSLDWQAREPR